MTASVPSLPDRIAEAIDAEVKAAMEVRRKPGAARVAEQVLRSAEVDRRVLEWARTSANANNAMLNLAVRYGVQP